MPDPHAESTFLHSKVNWPLLGKEEHASLRRLYRELFRLRSETPALRSHDLDAVEAIADEGSRTLLVRRANTLLALNFSDKAQNVALSAPDHWTAVIDTGAKVESGVLTVPALGFGLLMIVTPATGV